MAGQPKVTVNLVNGAIGGLVASLDGVSALVTTGVVTGLTGYALGDAKVIYSLPEVEALGITAGSANSGVHRQVKEFYAGYNEMTGLDKAELWLLVYSDTTTLAQLADQTHASSAKKLLDAAAGRIRLLALSRNPAAGYSPVTTACLDADCYSAVTAAQTMGETFRAAHKPYRTLIEGRSYTNALVGSLTSFESATNNRVAVVIGSSKNDGSASVAYAMGRKAGGAVQRNIGRVKSGKLAAVTQAYIGDTKVEAITALDAIHDKRYIFMKKYENVDGYFFNDDPMACKPTDDFGQLTHGCVIDKVHRIAYATFVNEINDDVDTVEGGKLHPAVIAALEARIEREVLLNMDGEISGFRAFIDPDQNVTVTNKLIVMLKVRRKGYLKEIEIPLGFEL